MNQFENRYQKHLENHTELTDEEMNQLNNDPKVKAFISFTKGEGYGRPLAEFATTGKPILVSNWSGHLDFLPKENAVLLEGELKEVHPSAANQFLLKESKWFTVNYSDAANKIYKVFNEYNTYLSKSAGLRTNILNNFTMKKMTEELGKIMDKYVGTIAIQKPFKLPKLNKQTPISEQPKLKLPKLNKL